MKTKILVIGIALALTMFLAAGCVGGGPSNETGETGQEEAVEENQSEAPDTGGTTENETSEETGESGITTADSIAYSVDASGPDFNGTQTTHYKAQGLGSEETKLYVEVVEKAKFILNQKQKKGWMKPTEEDKWYEFTAMGVSFDDYWNDYSTSMDNYVEYLSNWNTGTYDYTSEGGNKFHFYDIQVNPSLDSDTFDEPDNLAEMPSGY